MEVKNFANFGMWVADENIAYGRMEELISEAQQYAENHPGKSVDICFVEFDGDIDNENSQSVKGQVILSYHQLFEGKMIVTSGK